MSPSWKRVADCRSCSNDTLLGCSVAISTGKVEAGKWKGMVFIPRAQPLCRPVSLFMTLRGETEGVLSFLPSIPVKSFIIQLPDYFKNLTRLWFFSVFVCLTVWKGEWGIASGEMHPMALTDTPPPLPLPHPLFPHPSYTNIPQLLCTPFFYILHHSFTTCRLGATPNPPPVLCHSRTDYWLWWLSWHSEFNENCG